jgi:AcrB/AcrD/AcrF family
VYRRVQVIDHLRADSGVNEELATLPDAVAFGYSPPAIPGVGTSGGFTFILEDRSGGDVRFLSDNLNTFMAAAKQRPEIGGLSTTFLPSVPQQFVRVDRDKALKQGVPINEVYRTIQASWVDSSSTTSIDLDGSGKSTWATALSPAVLPDQNRNFGTAFLALLSFEVDIWGRLRRATEAARATLLGAEENRKAVVTTLVGDVATPI